jgi:hypothetical protein
MTILSIFVAIFLWFLFKWIFRLLGIFAILKMLQSLSINIDRNRHKKR